MILFDTIWYYLILFIWYYLFDTIWQLCGSLADANLAILAYEMFALRPSWAWGFWAFNGFNGFNSASVEPKEPVSGHAQMMSSTEHSIMINTTSIVCMVCPCRDSQMLLSPQCQFVCLLLKCTIWRSRPVSSCSPEISKTPKNTFWVVSNKSIQKIGTSRPICFDQFLKILELFTQAFCKWLSLPFVDCKMSIPDCHRHEATFSTTWETGAW